MIAEYKPIRHVILLCNKTNYIFNEHLYIKSLPTGATVKEQLIFNIRMQLAALRQLLRDRSTEMTDKEKDLILDQLIKLTRLLTELEKS